MRNHGVNRVRKAGVGWAVVGDCWAAGSVGCCWCGNGSVCPIVGVVRVGFRIVGCRSKVSSKKVKATIPSMRRDISQKWRVLHVVQVCEMDKGDGNINIQKCVKWKDSFVTHRAFCDALTEENYRMNQKVLESPQANTNNMMRSEFSHDSNHEKSMSNDFDPILFNQRTLMRPCFISSSCEPDNSLMSAAAYTSATALLQKAAEMGAKVSDNTIAPILLRGFSGYTTTNTTNASGLYDSSLIMPSTKGNNLLERHVFSERMTVDFLGVEPSSVCGKRDYDGNMIGIPYSDD
nr:protein indeterminate-domain 2-like [Tanacetum cinerariifolium]